LNDIKVLLDENPNCFLIIMPVLTKYLFKYFSGNNQLIYHTLFYFHPEIMEKLFLLASNGRIKMIGSENLVGIIEFSFDWDHYEVDALWNLISYDISSNLSFDYFGFLKFVIDKIKVPHPKLIQLYNKIEPTQQMIKLLMLQDNLFAASLVSVWIKTFSSSLKVLEGFCKELHVMDGNSTTIALKNISHIVNSCRDSIELFGFLKELIHLKNHASAKLVDQILEEVDVKKRMRDDNTTESITKKRKLDEE
jgi:hypothetical protein